MQPDTFDGFKADIFPVFHRVEQHFIVVITRMFRLTTFFDDAVVEVNSSIRPAS